MRTHYDVLGVPQDAGADQIRAAWTRAVTSLDPATDGDRLRETNTAAEVLLDPRRRAGHDADIAPAPAPEPAPGSGPVSAEGTTAARRRDPVRTRRLATLVLVGLLVAAVVVGGLAALVRSGASDSVATQEAWSSAPPTAERAAEAVLGYDYQRLAADKAAAQQWLTPAYRKEYDDQFAVLQRQATAKKVSVKADVYGSGIISANATQASVLLFVDQTRTLAGTEESPVANRVRFDMVLRDGRWLVSDIVSYDKL